MRSLFESSLFQFKGRSPGSPRLPPGIFQKRPLEGPREVPPGIPRALGRTPLAPLFCFFPLGSLTMCPAFPSPFFFLSGALLPSTTAAHTPVTRNSSYFRPRRGTKFGSARIPLIQDFIPGMAFFYARVPRGPESLQIFPYLRS